MVVVDAGHAFDYLAWYTIMVVREELIDKPTMSALMRAAWRIRGSCTCSAMHFKRLELERVGKVKLRRDVIESTFRKLGGGGARAAILNSSIGDRMNVTSKNPMWPCVLDLGKPGPSLELCEFATEAV
jgi:hypothetical protein